jgi:hypothetical protein
MNALPPADMTAEERIAELGEILARGLIRLLARKSIPLSAHCGESSVDFPAYRSGHADAPRRRTA